MIQQHTDKEQTYLKMENLQDIEYISNFNLVGSILIKWSKIRKTEELQTVIGCMNEMAFYNLKLKRERDSLLEIVSEYRADKIRAVERARKAEEKLYNK